MTLTCADTGGTGCSTTYYTTDGTTPTTSSTVYSSAISISSTKTLKFFSKDVAGNSETVKTENYTITIPRYIDNGNGTVTDTTTNLMWQKGQSSTTYDWYRASGTYHAGYNSNGVNVCGSLNLAGYSNWRLPSIDELKTIITGTTSPTIDTSVFTVDLYYMLFWSSTTATGVGYQDYVWSVDFNGGAGSIFYYNRGSYLSVRCVR